MSKKSAWFSHTAVFMCFVWPVYVPHNDHYMYHTVVNICTAQWPL